MAKKKKIFIIVAISLIVVIGIGLLLFFLSQKEEKEEERIPLFEEQLVHEETVYPEEEGVSPHDRSLVRERGEIDIFWLQNEKHYQVLSSEIIELMVGLTGWDKIKEVPPDTLKDYPQGPDFIAPETRSDNLLVRMKGTDYIFLINQGKREYLSQEEFQNRAYASKDVIEVSTKIIKLVPPASPVDHLSLQTAVKRDKIELIGSGKYFEEGVVFVAGPYDKNVAINIEKGDVLLSKAGRQSLIVTQDFEVFVPAGKKITLKGLWVACIDRFKAWPSAGEKLDVTLNVRDWKMETASELFDLIKLIDKKGINKEQFAQEAIWKITDNEPVGTQAQELLRQAGIDPAAKTTFLHLSNPNLLPQTSFVLPPELSLLGLVASYIANCPQTKKADKIICQEEMEAAFEVYLKQEDFPGTVGQKINSKVLNLLISFYLRQTSIDETLGPVAQEEINAGAESLLELLKQKGIEFPRFKVQDIKIMPSHIAEQESATFSVEGTGIKDIKVKVFNLGGEQVFESKRISGTLFEWHLRDASGEILTNGFYSYQIEARGFEQESLESPKRQLIIRL